LGISYTEREIVEKWWTKELRKKDKEWASAEVLMHPKKNRGDRKKRHIQGFWALVVRAAKNESRLKRIQKERGVLKSKGVRTLGDWPRKKKGNLLEERGNADHRYYCSG